MNYICIVVSSCRRNRLNAEFRIHLQFYIPYLYLFTACISSYIYVIDENFKSFIFQSLDPASDALFSYSDGSYYLHLNLNTFSLDPLFISQLYIAFGLSYSVLTTVRQCD